MVLTKSHRAALLSNLKAKRQELETERKLLHVRQEKENGENTEWCEIKIFLLEKEIDVIETSLIDNEIDF